MEAVTTTATVTGWPYKKRTLIKPLVGQVKTPSLPLPGPTHVYGARVQKDSETAATLLSKWTTATAADMGSAAAGTDGRVAAPQSWIRTNVAALKQGHLTAREQRAFAKRHPHITVPLKRVVKGAANIKNADGSPSSSSSRAKALAAAGFAFGKGTASNGETLKDVIEGRFAPAALEPEFDYPRGIVAVLAARLPKPRPTRASRLLKATQAAQLEERAAKEEEEERKPTPLWTLPRFRRVKAKIQTGPGAA